MEDKIIELKYKRSYFEEIYFRNGNNKTFLNPQFKKEQVMAILAGILLVALLFPFLDSQENVGLIIFPSFLFLSVMIDWYLKAKSIIKWKREIKFLFK